MLTIGRGGPTSWQLQTLAVFSCYDLVDSQDANMAKQKTLRFVDEPDAPIALPRRNGEDACALRF